MNYKISVAENRRYIICRVIGPMTVDIARQFTEALDRLSRSSKIKRFLIDARNAPNISGVLHNYTFARRDMKNLDLQRDARSAILVDPDDESHDFVETVTQNAGYNVRVFDDEAAATAWVDEKPGADK